MRDYIRLYVNGRPVDVWGDDAFLTLSDFLRRRRRLTGTKVVCAEGDCGSCSVLVGRPARRDTGFQPVRGAPGVGKPEASQDQSDAHGQDARVTDDALRSRRAPSADHEPDSREPASFDARPLTPARSPEYGGEGVNTSSDARRGAGDGRMRYASVTSCIQLMFQLDGAHVVTVEGLRDGRELNPIQQSMVTCQGTQCGFCTPGFVVALYDLMQDGTPVDAEAVRRGLVGNLCRCTGYDSIVRAAMTTDRSALKPLDALYPPGPIADDLSAVAAEEVLIETENRRFYKPVTVEQATRFRGENPGCVVIAGATDMGVVYNKRTRAIDVALSLGGLAELRGVTSDEDALYVGACAPLAALERAALEHSPEFGRYLAYFGSPLIKNAGTLGGNLVTGSPIGDTLPPLIVLGAEIDVAGVGGTRRVPIGQFYTGYRQTVLGPDELVTGVRVPLPRAGETFKLYKVSRRKDLDISSFSAAVWARVAGGIVEDVRIACGGVGPMVLRMAKTEAVLRGQPATLAQFERAGDVARDEVTPISDVRGSQGYRRTLAANILSKFWHEAVGSGGGGGGTSGDGNGRAPPEPDAPLVRRSAPVAGVP